MHDPTSHADDMMSRTKPEPMPSLWWLTPWSFAIQQWNQREIIYAELQDCENDLRTARQDAANFSDHATYHEQRYADQSYELNALNDLNHYRTKKTCFYERPVIKAKRKLTPKAKAKTAKKAKR